MQSRTSSTRRSMCTSLFSACCSGRVARALRFVGAASSLVNITMLWACSWQPLRRQHHEPLLRGSHTRSAVATLLPGSVFWVVDKFVPLDTIDSRVFKYTASCAHVACPATSSRTCALGGSCMPTFLRSYGPHARDPTRIPEGCGRVPQLHVSDGLCTLSGTASRCWPGDTGRMWTPTRPLRGLRGIVWPGAT